MANCYSTADFLGDGVISVESISDTAVVPAHSHEFIEMIYLSDGRALHTCKGKAERMEKGDYVFVDYGAVHGFTEKSADFHAVSCLFVPEFIDISLRNSRSVSDILKNRSIGMFSAEYAGNIFHDADGGILRELDFMLDEFTEKRPGYLQMMRSGLLKIIITSVRGLGTKPYSDDPIVKRIIDYTDENYAESGNLSHLALELNYSVSRLCKLFCLAVGMSYSEYLRRTRIHISCRMLAVGNDSVEKVAERVGYADVRAYRKSFKLVMGTTPLKYRLSLKSEK